MYPKWILASCTWQRRHMAEAMWSERKKKSVAVHGLSGWYVWAAGKLLLCIGTIIDSGQWKTRWIQQIGPLNFSPSPIVSYNFCAAHTIVTATNFSIICYESTRYYNKLVFVAGKFHAAAGQFRASALARSHSLAGRLENCFWYCPH